MLILLLVLVAGLSVAAVSGTQLTLTSTDWILFGLFVLSLLFLCLALGIFFVKHMRRKAFENVSLFEIDRMSGVDFENFVAHLYEKRGYAIRKTALSGDFGVDLIATRGDKKIAIQVKRYSGSVGRSAISDAVAGMVHYKCSSCAVVTNSFFTKMATQIAQTNRCQLVDRAQLVKFL